MKNNQQTVNDIRELLTLVSETIVENDGKINKVDNNVNTVGKTVVATNETANEVKEMVDSQTEMIQDVRDNQNKVAESTDRLITIIKEAQETLQNNDVTIGEILEALESNRVISKEQHENTLERINDLDNDQTEKFDSVMENIADVKSTVEKLNIDEPLQSFIDEIAKSHDTLAGIRELEETRIASQNERLSQYEDLANRNTENLTKLIDTANAMNVDFQNAIARMSNISLKLDAIMEDSNITIPETIEEPIDEVFEESDTIEDTNETEVE